MSQFMLAMKVFCIICVLAGVGSVIADDIGRALPHSGPTASTEAPPWSAL